MIETISKLYENNTSVRIGKELSDWKSIICGAQQEFPVSQMLINVYEVF